MCQVGVAQGRMGTPGMLRATIRHSLRGKFIFIILISPFHRINSKITFKIGGIGAGLLAKLCGRREEDVTLSVGARYLYYIVI